MAASRDSIFRPFVENTRRRASRTVFAGQIDRTQARGRRRERAKGTRKAAATSYAMTGKRKARAARAAASRKKRVFAMSMAKYIPRDRRG